MQHLAPWRKGKGWRQVDLAKAIEVDVSTIKRWERGETSPYPYHLERLHQLGFGQVVLSSSETVSSSLSGELPGKSTLLSARAKTEYSSTYFVQDRSNQEELDRLIGQDRMITTVMGGVFPEQPAPPPFRRILDVGCGTGGWLIDIAREHPSIETLIGVDISSKMVSYARRQLKAQNLHNQVEFLTMDALRMLEFPPKFFDLVNMRFGLSFLRTWDWPKLVQEFQRVTKSGGIIRITETTLEAKSNSPTLTGLQNLTKQALSQAGHLSEESVVTGIPHMLKQYGIEQVRTCLHEGEYHASTQEGQQCIEDITRFFRTALPFLRKWVQVPDDYESVYQQMLAEIQQPDFMSYWPLVTVWGHVR
jgi:ubiquinone/menaquinone biosynthesis C-methylase UbiE